MDATDRLDTEQLLALARAGDADALGRVLEHFRGYLTVLARIQIGRRLQGKVDDSDLIQDAFLEAHRHFGQFRGTTEAELIAWLRQILAGRLGRMVRHYFGTRQRDIRLEQELAMRIDQSSRAMDGGVAC